MPIRNTTEKLSKEQNTTHRERTIFKFITWLVGSFILIGCVSAARHPSSTPPEAVVAIFADLHEELDLELKVLEQMRARGVTDVVGLGDFILFEGLPALDEALRKITPLTGVPKDRVHLLSGNWEQTLNDRDSVNQTLSRYGHLITPDYDRTGYLDLAGWRVRAGHFAQHPLPPELTPAPKHMSRIEGQITLGETLVRGEYPDRATVLELTAHTHIGGIYFDGDHRLWVLNPGDLEPRRKSPGEPQAYALLYPASGRLQFINAPDGTVLREVWLNDPKEPCRQQVCVLNGRR